jgi:hypothetical protein
MRLSWMSGVQGAPLAGVSKAERGRSPLCKLRVQGSAPRRNFHLKMTCFYSKFQIATGAPDIKIITPVKTTIGVMTVMRERIRVPNVCRFTFQGRVGNVAACLTLGFNVTDHNDIHIRRARYLRVIHCPARGKREATPASRSPSLALPPPAARLSSVN